jgi:hypothetical protein
LAEPTVDFACPFGVPWGATTAPPATEGPGTVLKRYLARIGIVPAPGCKCTARAAEMDARGPDWCEANLGLIVGWLAEEAGRRRLPFAAMAALALVRVAIRRARALAAGNSPTNAGFDTTSDFDATTVGSDGRRQLPRIL